MPETLTCQVGRIQKLIELELPEMVNVVKMTPLFTIEERRQDKKKTSEWVRPKRVKSSYIDNPIYHMRKRAGYKK